MIQSFLLTSAFLLTAAAPAEPPRRVEFTRLLDHLVGYEDPGYLKFIEDVKPEVVQVGWYGAHLYGPSPYEGGTIAELAANGRARGPDTQGARARRFADGGEGGAGAL